MTLFGLGLVVILLAGVGAVVLERRGRVADRVFRWGILSGCLIAVLPAIAGLVSVEGSQVAWPALIGEPYRLDALSAWFLVIVLGVGGNTAIYGIPYLEGERGHRRIGGVHLLLAILLVALSGVVTARTIVGFMAAWEVMAVAAYLLVVFDRDRAEVRRAGLIYLVLAHTGILALLAMFAAWAGGASGWTFADLAAASPRGAAPAGFVLLMAIIGFGIKAGAVPGHFWLPGAHAAAPSHVSALLSGVMLKTGIYGLLRVLTLFGPPPAWWGWTILFLGLASAVLGVLWALAQHDLKRLLAYHSVENIGIILLGLGLGALGQAYHQPALALLGFTGALLHSLNHALFKSLLFLGAGAVGRVTGTFEIDRLGGLARTMPRTAGAFLIGSLAIVGLPPLNGFVSEWLIFRGLLQTGATTGPLRLACVTVAGLALAGALALACFTKLQGTLFLGMPRDRAVRPEPTGDAGLTAPQLVLAAACILVGLAPLLVVPLAARAAAVVLGGDLEYATVAVAADSAATISVLALVLFGLGALLWRVRDGRVVARMSATWACAYPGITSQMQYTASSYAGSLLAIFGPLSGIRAVVGPTTRHGPGADPVLDAVGGPLWDGLGRVAGYLRLLQTGRIRRYLLYVIASLLALLVYLWAVTTR